MSKKNSNNKGSKTNKVLVSYKQIFDSKENDLFLVPDISSAPHLMRAGYPLDALGVGVGRPPRSHSGLD